MFTDARDYHQRTAELLQNSLSQIGITLKIETMELPHQIEVMSTGEGFDLYMLDNVGFSSYAFVQPLWRDSHPRFAQVNSSHFRFYTVDDAQGQKYSDLLDEILVTIDEAERLELCHEVQKVFIEDIIWISVNSIQSYCLSSDNLQGTEFRGGNLFVTEATYFS